MSIGYWISEEYEGRGIITASVQKLISYAFEKMGVNRIVILCDSDNERSARVAEKLGFTLEGIIQRDEKRYGAFYNYKIYALLKNERELINADDIFLRTKKFAKFIRLKKNKIIKILTMYETHKVAEDEINRTLDLFENLKENQNYFIKKIRKSIAFLPINQPLYALSCFAIVPSLMAEQVFVRPPQVSWKMMNELTKQLCLENFFPNIFISNQKRASFIEEHTLSHTDVVIFTGNSDNAIETQKQFGDDVLFIGNGSSHNPVIISLGADIKNAVAGILEVQLYNQGGDCAAPNAILVHKQVYLMVLNELRAALKKIKTGEYKNRNVTVGPFLEKKHFKNTLLLLEKHKAYLDPQVKVEYDDIKNILKPAIILKPLAEGGNYEELFAPIFFIQLYKDDAELSKYFENENYQKQAAYITLYGESNYVDSLENRRGSVQRQETIVRNTHLHAPGIERGTQPYGGYGTYSSFISYKGITVSKPTLPQRDIFEFLIAYKDHSLEEIKKEICVNAKAIFGTDLKFIFLTGSVTYGGAVLGKSDLDVVLIFDDSILNKDGREKFIEKTELFSKAYIQIHKKFGFTPDLLFPGEFLTLSMVRDAIAGRGFVVKNNILTLPLTSNDYYLTSEDTWFRAWLSMLAFSLLLFGNPHDFREIQKSAWKTIILYMLKNHERDTVTPHDILSKMKRNTNKATGFGVTSNYALFESLEMPAVRTIFENLMQENYLIKKGRIFVIKKEKLKEWETSVVKNITKKNFQAQLPLTIGDVKKISKKITTLYNEQ